MGLVDWDWQVFCKDTIDGNIVPGCFGRSGDITYLDWLLSAWGWTLSVSALALLVALALGSLMGILRTTPNRWLVLLGNAWTELFRNVPLLVQIFLWYHVVPALIPPLRDVPSFILVVMGLGLFTSARISEQVRAGIQSLAGGQRMAGLAMGFTLPQTYRYVMLPMAVRLIVPPLTSEFLNIFKNSAVCSTIGLLELAAQGRQLVDYTAQPYESFIAVTIAYLLINVVVMFGMRWVEGHVRVPGYIGGK
jgi:glutamate/aspartate transport system permease protein